jgi:hypothetical protein
MKKILCDKILIGKYIDHINTLSAHIKFISMIFRNRNHTPIAVLKKKRQFHSTVNDKSIYIYTLYYINNIFFFVIQSNLQISITNIYSKIAELIKIQCYKKVTLYLYDRKEINRMIIILLQDYLGRTVLDT